MTNKALKENLLNQCQGSLNTRLNAVKTIIDDLKQSLQSETKSSAGDKHETGRAMVQLEREKAGHQLAEIQKTQDLLAKINIENTTSNIGLGSVVLTSNANYFISISAGEFKVDDQSFYAISPSTPIAKILLGKTINDEFTFRNNTFVIKAVI